MKVLHFVGYETNFKSVIRASYIGVNIERAHGHFSRSDIHHHVPRAWPSRGHH